MEAEGKEVIEDLDPLRIFWGTFCRPRMLRPAA